MTKGFWIIMRNSAGELDRAFATTETKAALAMIEMVQRTGELNDGDRFTIEEGETEEVEERYDERI